MPFKPYDLAAMTVATSQRRRTVEVISHPTPDETIMVRMVPGEPTTMREVRVADLIPAHKRRYVHVARVACGFAFPEDMLRYDSAALFDHDLHEQGADGEGLRLSDDDPEAGLVYRLSDKKVQDWTVGRWLSFSASITPVLTRDLRTEKSYMKDS